MAATRAAVRKESPPSEEMAEYRELFLELLKNGDLDWFSTEIDRELDKRVAAYEREKKEENTPKPVTRSPAEKKSVPAPTRSKPPESAPTVVPEVGVTYVINDKVKKFGGAEVEFLRFRKDDQTKVVVKMVSDIPGAPAGKQVVLPLVVLKKKITSRRRVAAKKSSAPAKRTVAVSKKTIKK